MQGGYQQGVRKKIVLDAHAQGKSIQQLVREGQPYNACLSAATRCGIRLKTESGRVGWGIVKQVVSDADDNEWTIQYASMVSGLKIKSIQDCMYKLKIKLKSNGKKQKTQITA